MKIGIIGMGHLGKAVLTGLLRSGASPEEMTASARTEKTLEMIRAEYPGVGVTPDNLELIRNTDAVMIALRPGDAAGVLGELKDADLSGKTVISLMAGITIREIREMLQDDRCEYTVLRVMPNIGVSMCKGIIGVSSDRDGCEPEAVTELLRKLGVVIRLPENKLENITICAASGLGFAAYIMKQYMDSCNRLFMDESVGEKITRKVFEAAIDLAGQEDSSFEKLVEQISTKGGTTEAGIRVLECSGLEKILDECFDEAIAKVRK